MRVLRQHELGLQVQAEVINVVANQQQQHPPQHQGATGTGPTVTEADDQDGDHLDFLGVQNPNTGPPNTGPFGVNQIQQSSTGMAIVPRLSELWKVLKKANKLTNKLKRACFLRRCLRK